jgi:hypothetical protein
MFMSFAMAAAALGFFAVMVWTAGEEPLDIDMVWSMPYPPDDAGGDGDARVGGAGEVAPLDSATVLARGPGEINLGRRAQEQRPVLSGSEQLGVVRRLLRMFVCLR